MDTYHDWNTGMNANGEEGNGTSSCASVWKSEAERKALITFPLIGASLSLIGGIFIVVTFCLFARVRKMQTFQLICLMSVADIFASLSRFLTVSGVNEDGQDCDVSPACYAQAGMSQYFETAGFFWVMCISAHIYYVIHIVQGAPTANQRKRAFIAYNVVSWGVPFILLMIAAGSHVLGDAGTWCWIGSDHQWARISLYYVWLLVVTCVNLSIYADITRAARARRGLVETRNPLAFRLRLYILAFVLTHIFSILNRLQNVIDPDKPVFALYLLQSIFEPMNGFTNALVYGMNHIVVIEYGKIFRKMEWFAVPQFASTRDANEAGSDDRAKSASLGDVLLRGTADFDEESDDEDGVRYVAPARSVDAGA